MPKFPAAVLSLVLLGTGVAALLPLAGAHSCGHTNLTDSVNCDAHVCTPTAYHYHWHRPLNVGPAHYCWTTAAATTALGDVWVPLYGVGDSDGGRLVLP